MSNLRLLPCLKCKYLLVYNKDVGLCTIVQHFHLNQIVKKPYVHFYLQFKQEYSLNPNLIIRN